MGPDHLRGLALTCAVLILIGVLALVRHEELPGDVSRDAATLSARAASAGTDEAGGDSGASTEVPPSLLPLFPSTTSTLLSRTTSTSATATPASTAADAVAGPPALGTYTYAVSGTEQLNGMSRALPSPMTLAVRSAAPREVVFESRFSDQHTDREHVVFGPDAVAVRVATSNVKVGLATRSTDGAYAPSVPHAVLPLTAGATRGGASEVRDTAGQLLRVEDWKVIDIGPRRLPIAGANVRAWEITLERTSRPGAVEQLRETRRGWFDPARRMWVRWENTLHTQRTIANRTTTYDLTYAATLTAFAPA